jgi:hypothetical protein
LPDRGALELDRGEGAGGRGEFGRIAAKVAALACSSPSMTRTSAPVRAGVAAMLAASVLLPTPPLMLPTVRISAHLHAVRTTYARVNDELAACVVRCRAWPVAQATQISSRLTVTPKEFDSAAKQ